MFRADWFRNENTLVYVINKYYEYRRDMDGEKRGLVIEGFESVWLADLVVAYLLKQTENLFSKFIYHGIYYDDEFIIMK